MRYQVGYAKGRVTVGDVDFPFEQPLLAEDVPMGSSLRDLVGDGEAKVSIGLEIANKDFGNGISAFTNVTLTCSQDEEAIFEAGEVAQELARDLLDQAIRQADGAYEDAFEGD